jgi:Domain of Unknown Function (DUF1080)
MKREHETSENRRNKRNIAYFRLFSLFPFVSCSLLILLTLTSIQRKNISGRWDITVNGSTGSYPCWLEVSNSGDLLTGRFVGRWGAVHPVKSIRFDGHTFELTIDQKGENWPHDLIFKGKFADGRLSGTTLWSGEEQVWTASRAPSLVRSKIIDWGKPIHLLNGTNLNGWKTYPQSKTSRWAIEDGVLVNAASGANLLTEQRFDDFRLQFEFKIEPGSDSGVYLRGRYEIEIEDSFGKTPDSHRLGGIYGFLTPASNPAKRAGEWQSFDATLVGRRVTVDLNGVRIIDNEEIPGITGGALDSDEGNSGPLMLQGDYGKVSYRKIIVTPAQ